MAVAKCFYFNALAFNVADSQAFKDMVDAIVAYGHEYKPPSSNPLRNDLLDACKKSVSDKLEVNLYCFYAICAYLGA